MNEKLAINTLKVNGVAAVNKANSGHPGIVISAAIISHTLFTRHINYDPAHPDWINRDRFILSAGHGSALLYSQLRLLGLVETEDLKQFRKLKSLTPGHPEYGHTKGVEATTGPLGQGIATAVGVALGETSLAANFKEIDHYTYVLCGDGDLEEGVAMESMSFAGHNKLNKLIVLHDSNDIQLDTPVKYVFSENLKMRMEAIGWNYQRVNNTIDEIDEALTKAKNSDKPSFIEVKTIIGEGTNKEGTTSVHGAPLGEDFKPFLEKIGWDLDPFAIPEEVKTLYQETIFKRGKKAFDKFQMSSELKSFLERKPQKIDIELSKNVATRVSSGEVIKHLNANYKNWIGGSADLVASTKAGGGDDNYSPTNRKGRNILFGVREFAMAAIANGLALHSNFRPFVSTFFVFADYLKPALRLAALMKLPVTYIFTHDSVFVGEDGPTHEPIDQAAMIRAIPNVNLIRPADEKEVLGAYNFALQETNKPTAIVLTRQNIKSLEETSAEKVALGSYYLRKSSSEWTIVATGSEVANALEIAKELDLNMVSLTNFANAKVDWDTNKAITIEVLATLGFSKFGKYNIGLNRFGESGDGASIYKYLGFDLDLIRQKVQSIIK